MRQLFIPTIGDNLELAADWNFRLFAERRNRTLVKKLDNGIHDKDYAYSFPEKSRLIYFWVTNELETDLNNLWDRVYAPDTDSDINRKEYHSIKQEMMKERDDEWFEHIMVNLIETTIIKVDRIYIRKGNSGYDSMSFYVQNGPCKGARFWAKLEDVNQMKIK